MKHGFPLTLVEILSEPRPARVRIHGHPRDPRGFARSFLLFTAARRRQSLVQATERRQTFV